MKVNRKLIAPCGLDCLNCIVYENNIAEKVQSAVAKNLNIQQETVPFLE